MIKVFGREYYALPEAAKMAHCAPGRLYALRRAGLLRCACLTPQGASRWEYHCTREALLDALEAQLPTRPPAARKILREKFGMNV